MAGAREEQKDAGWGDELPHPLHPGGLGDQHCGLVEGPGQWQACLDGSWLFNMKYHL